MTKTEVLLDELMKLSAFTIIGAINLLSIAGVVLMALVSTVFFPEEEGVQPIANINNRLVNIRLIALIDKPLINEYCFNNIAYKHLLKG